MDKECFKGVMSHGGGRWAHLPWRHVSSGAQHGLQEFEQLAEHKDGLPTHHLLPKVGDVGRVYATGRAKPLRQGLPATQLIINSPHTTGKIHLYYSYMHLQIGIAFVHLNPLDASYLCALMALLNLAAVAIA